MQPSGNPGLDTEADALAETGYVVEGIAPDYSSHWRVADKESRGRKWRIVARPRFGPESPTPMRVLELGRWHAAGIASFDAADFHFRAGVLQAQAAGIR